MTNTNARRGRRIILSNNIQPGSIDMQNAKLTCTFLCLLAATALLGSVESAAAKSKPTYDQAWALCTKQLNKTVPRDSSARYSAGAACMMKYGYRI
jgi:molybdenum-dependent DNA-binding transcriptional regulator ModE